MKGFELTQEHLNEAFMEIGNHKSNMPVELFPEGDVGVQIEKIDPAPEYFDEGSASHTCSSGCDPTTHMNREEKRAFKRSLRKRGR